MLTALLFAGVVAGQVLRISPFTSSGASASVLDLAVGIVLLVLVGVQIASGALEKTFSKVFSHPAWELSGLFLAVIWLSLLINAGDYAGNELAVAGAFAVRLTAVFVLAWLVWNRASQFRKPILTGFTIASAALMLLGFLQLIIVPDFKFAVSEGWDPHLGRLFSTFLDPNFFGLYAVLAMAISLALYFANRRHRASLAYLAVFFASWAALYLAFSRSAWVAGLLAIPAIAWKVRPRLAVGIALVFIGLLFLPTRLSDRFESTQGLIRTSDFSGQEYECSAGDDSCDPSGSARVYSLKDGFALATENPVLGVGYNAYAFAQQQRGADVDLEEHAANGSDSSLLNVWATTGVFGLLAFLAFFATVLWRLWQRSSGSTEQVWVARGLFWFTLAWVAASFFNNALFYGLILLPWLLLLAVTIGPARAKGRS